MKKSFLIMLLSLSVALFMVGNSWAYDPDPYCGDGILDDGEFCDDGNNVDGDGCSAECTVEKVGEGCTPGYWKQKHHFDSWVGYASTDSFDDVFGVDAFPSMTLLDVLKQGGGGIKALGRHAVAALLNASSFDVSYDETITRVKELFNFAYSDGRSLVIETTKNRLEFFNEQGCPLN